MTVKHRAFVTVDQALRPLGLGLVKRSRLTASRRVRFCQQEEIDVVLDVGAATGEYGHGLRDEGYKGRIVSFEPLPESYAVLDQECRQDSLWDCRMFALGEAAGTAPLNVAGNRNSSSVLPMLDRHVAGSPSSATTGTIDIRVEALDDIDVVNPSDNVMLKMDTQGFEAQVLAGSHETLPSIRLIETEMSLIPLYEGAPSYLEMIELLAKKGFEPIWFERGFEDEVNGHLLQFDCIFGRT